MAANSGLFEPIRVQFPDDDVNAFIEAEFSRLKDSIAANIMSHRMNATGKTIQSMKIQKGKDGNGNTIALIGRENFGNLETGTPPGSQGAGFEKDILEWVMAKFPIQTEQAALSFAVYVARKIKAEGSLRYRSGDRADIFTTARADSFIKIDDYIDSKIQIFLNQFTI